MGLVGLACMHACLFIYGSFVVVAHVSRWFRWNHRERGGELPIPLFPSLPIPFLLNLGLSLSSSLRNMFMGLCHLSFLCLAWMIG